MKELSNGYFYGVLVASIFSCLAMSEFYAADRLVGWALNHAVWESPHLILLIIEPIVGLFLGIIPAIVLLSIPFGLSQRADFRFQLLGGLAAGVGFIFFGFLGVWPASSVRLLIAGHTALGLIEITAPLVVGALAAWVFRWTGRRFSATA